MSLENKAHGSSLEVEGEIPREHKREKLGAQGVKPGTGHHSTAVQGLGTLPGEALGLGLRKERPAQLPRRLGCNLLRSWRTEKKASPKSATYSGLCFKNVPGRKDQAS